MITAIFLLLLLPVCLHYRGLELQHHHSAGGGHGSSDTSAKLRHHGPRGHRHRERSPPPKYHESELQSFKQTLAMLECYYCFHIRIY